MHALVAMGVMEIPLVLVKAVWIAIVAIIVLDAMVLMVVIFVQVVK